MGFISKKFVMRPAVLGFIREVSRTMPGAMVRAKQKIEDRKVFGQSGRSVLGIEVERAIER
jgi:hypothetical protein